MGRTNGEKRAGLRLALSIYRKERKEKRGTRHMVVATRSSCVACMHPTFCLLLTAGMENESMPHGSVERAWHFPACFSVENYSCASSPLDLFLFFSPFFYPLLTLPSSTRRSNVSITRNTDDGWTFYRKLFCAFRENRCFDRCFSFLFAIGDWRTRKRLFTRMARNNDLFHSPRIFLRFLCILIERDV